MNRHSRELLGQWNYSAWYNNGGYMSLYICHYTLYIIHVIIPDMSLYISGKCTTPRENLIKTMDSEWYWYVSVGLLIVTHAQL